MKVTRRNFLKLSATALAATAFGGLGVSLNPTLARAQLLKLRWSKQTTSICPYCAVGCGLVVHTALDGSGRAVNVEGDPDHPVNEGALCAKGASIWQLCENDKRITNCLYRAPNSEHWEVKSWDWMLATIAQRIKQTRDKTWETKNSKGQIVNRTEGIASVGSAALDNEECWLYQGFLRALGLVYIEHQARPCHSSTVAALAESFGRGAMTNHWIDIKNADCIWIQGSNAAENHPISFKWITEAKERGATIINLDPRFTRTSAKADIYAAFRSGTDIAIFGGLIKYILDNDLIQKDYVVSHTNATFIVNEKFESNVNGLFSGFDAKKQAYDKACWAFDLDENGVPKMDPSLKHERCVYQLLKKHYARYSVENVSQCSGAPVELLNKAYEAYAATGKPDKAGTFMYAMGQTQHTYGV
ncbi:MAG: molybdopterin-dependent oxidoreductase, partial [Desulfovibrionaceae bacterium]|nr:molybdopterin-dependent oxidoreductase [Desulfovibrionaceae bacterium]